jgi:hypothetical protein
MDKNIRVATSPSHVRKGTNMDSICAGCTRRTALITCLAHDGGGFGYMLETRVCPRCVVWKGSLALDAINASLLAKGERERERATSFYTTSAGPIYSGADQAESQVAA